MAYEEYKNSGRSLGKVLYQLSKLGIPLRIVESVRLVSTGVIKNGANDFATFEWNEENTPIFQFQVPYDCYCSLKQDPLYTVMVSIDYGATFNKHCVFSFKNPYEQPRWLFGHEFYVLNRNGDKVDEKLNPILTPKPTIEDRFKLLQQKFSKT